MTICLRVSAAVLSYAVITIIPVWNAIIPGTMHNAILPARHAAVITPPRGRIHNKQRRNHDVIGAVYQTCGRERGL